MNGILLVNKPKDWTSFDVVAKIRRLTQIKRVGHSGTLDPMATGILPVFLGEATKAIKYFLNGDKGYRGEMILGATTETGDATGQTRQTRPRGQTGPIGMAGQEGLERLKEVFKKFTGEIKQVPPMFSAVKVNGVPLYKLARKGIIVKREPRKIKIYKLELIEAGIEARHRASKPGDDTTSLTDNQITFYVECSKGTYIRQLVVDMGEELGCGAYLSKLERVYSHPFHISSALPMETIVNLARIEKLERVIISVEEILNDQRTS